MSLISQIIDMCLYFTSLEQVSVAIDCSGRLYLLVFCESRAIGHLSDAMDRSDHLYLLVFSSPEGLSDAFDRSDR